MTIAPKYLTTSHPLQATSFPRNLLEQATKGFLVRFGMPPHAHKQKDRGLPASRFQSTKTPVSQSHSLPGHVSTWCTYLGYKGQRKVEEKQKARGVYVVYHFYDYYLTNKLLAGPKHAGHQRRC